MPLSDILARNKRQFSASFVVKEISKLKMEFHFHSKRDLWRQYVLYEICIDHAVSIFPGSYCQLRHKKLFIELSRPLWFTCT